MRASVSIPPTASCLDCSFRIYRKQRTTFADLVEWDALTGPAANFSVACRLGDDAHGGVRGAGLGQVDVHGGVDRGDAVDDERADHPEVPRAVHRPAHRRGLDGGAGRQ